MHFKKNSFPLLSQEQLSFLNQFFLHCPDSFLPYLMIRTYPKDYILIHTDDTCAHVYILLKGRLQAIEERTAKSAYKFTELTAFEIFGDFELFIKTRNRIITLTTLEQSLCMVIPSNAYLSWIQSDPNALFIRIQMLITQFTAQTQFERQNFFLDNRGRLLHFLCSECRRMTFCPPSYVIRYTRSHLAAVLGCSVRTINRLVNQMESEELVSLIHGKIHINAAQYERMGRIVEEGEQSACGTLNSPAPHS